MNDEVKTGLDCYFPECRVFPEFSKRERELDKRDVLLIMKWKLNRLKGAAAETIKDENIEKIRKAVTLAQKSDQKLAALEMLMSIPGIKLALATTILTLCYPDEFTIIDRRVLKQLGFPEDKQNTAAWTRQEYLEIYLPRVIERSKAWNISLRDTDRALWGLSVSKQIEGLIR